MQRFRFHDFVVPDPLVGERLDKVLGAQQGCSRTLARKLLDAGAVFVNGRRVRRASLVLRAGDRVRAPEQLPPDAHVELGPPLYRDGRVLVLDKPSGVPSAPTPLGIRGTLPELARQQLGLPERPIVVHRLDVDVSGVMALALNRAGARVVTSWFTGGLARKWYRAVVQGSPPERQGRIDAPIGRDPARPGRMRIDPQGDAARTDYRVLGAPAGLPECTELELRLHTGRTHQLRVHLASLGCPVVGDRWYGGARRLVDDTGAERSADRICLHSHRLEVTGAGPGGAALVFEAPVPDFFARG
ncbi:MAG: RluA family pseudouridine synthase [bacterium]